tara:strand:+ start:1010 stop:1705 length:696 start_codon:yes stop_codon:yes gene_type:complete
MITNRPIVFTLLATALFTGSVAAAPPATLIPLDEEKIGPQVELHFEEDIPILRVIADDNSTKAIHVLNVESPEISGEAYAVQGEVRYQDVTGDGYLEMWNHLPIEAGGDTIGASFFSRTLGKSGPMQKLSGNSDWRHFQLPAIINDDSGKKPIRLTINVVLPDTGTVEIRNLQLIPNLPLPDISTGKAISITFLGIASLAITPIAVLTFFILKKKRTRAELNRIRSVDAVS